MAATLADMILIVPAALIILGKTIFAAATAPILGTYGAPTFSEHVINSGVRAMLEGFSIRQLQLWCAKKYIIPDIADIPDAPGAKACWIGNRSSAKYTMLYFHGGGFILPGSDSHLDLMHRFVQWSNGKLAICAVSYTLSPAAVYPTAIAQCVESVRHVLNLPGNKPSNVLLGGDSAGGNLVLAILSHISHPHPQSDIVKPLSIDGPFKGAVLVDPWISVDSEKYASMKRLANRDTLTPRYGTGWAAAYQGPGVPEDTYMWATRGTAKWWTDIKCDRMIATVGEDETLFDAVIDWAAKYRLGMGHDTLDLVVGKKETHIAPVLLSGRDNDVESQEYGLKKWVAETLM